MLFARRSARLETSVAVRARYMSDQQLYLSVTLIGTSLRLTDESPVKAFRNYSAEQPNAPLFPEESRRLSFALDGASKSNPQQPGYTVYQNIKGLSISVTDPAPNIPLPPSQRLLDCFTSEEAGYIVEALTQLKEAENHAPDTTKAGQVFHFEAEIDFNHLEEAIGQLMLELLEAAQRPSRTDE